MNNFTNTYLARLIAVVAAPLITWLSLRYGLGIDQTQQAEIIEKIVSIAQLIWGIAYIFFHRTISKSTNPGDAASSHLANVENSEVAQLKKIKS